MVPFRLPSSAALLLGAWTALSASAADFTVLSDLRLGKSPAGISAMTDVVLNPLIVAGDPNGTFPGPDSPAQRIDPNVPASPYAGVVSLRIDAPGGGAFLCTGTVLSPNTILTAGHCVDFDDNGSADAAGSDITVFFNNTAVPATRAGAAVWTHPDYGGFNNPPGTVNDDLAIVRLAQNVPAGVPSYPLLPAGVYNPVTDLFSATFVGYGLTGDGISGYTGASSSFTVKRTGGNIVEAYDLDDEGSGKVEIWYADFEKTIGQSAPGAIYDGDPATDAIGALTGFPFSLTLGNTIESNTGPGDSGGPLFVEGPGGQIFLAGTSTFGADILNTRSGGFGSLNGGMWIESYIPWVESMMQHSLAIPEPSTYAAGLALGAVGFLTWRRQRRALRA